MLNLIESRDDTETSIFRRRFRYSQLYYATNAAYERSNERSSLEQHANLSMAEGSACGSVARIDPENQFRIGQTKREKEGTGSRLVKTSRRTTEHCKSLVVKIARSIILGFGKNSFQNKGPRRDEKRREEEIEDWFGRWSDIIEICFG